MSVTVQPISIGGGRTQSSAFSDSFGTVGVLGANWLVGVLRQNAGTPVAFPSVQVSASAVDGNPCMKLSTFNNAVGSVTRLIVAPIQPVGILNRSQFVQWTVVRHLRTAGVNSLFCGPTVLMTSQSGIDTQSSAYIFQLQTPGAIGAVIRRNGAVETGLGAAIAFADGDVIKMVATINSANVTIQLFINGVLMETDVDVAANRVTTGMPGFMATSLNEPSANYVSEWRNFSCGPA